MYRPPPRQAAAFHRRPCARQGAAARQTPHRVRRTAQSPRRAFRKPTSIPPICFSENCRLCQNDLLIFQFHYAVWRMKCQPQTHYTTDTGGMTQQTDMRLQPFCVKIDAHIAQKACFARCLADLYGFVRLCVRMGRGGSAPPPYGVYTSSAICRGDWRSFAESKTPFVTLRVPPPALREVKDRLHTDADTRKHGFAAFLPLFLFDAGLLFSTAYAIL